MSQQIDKLVEKKVKAIQNGENVYEIGHVIKANDYVVEVDGLSGVGFFEKVRIGDKAEGYVSNIRRNSVGVALVKTNGEVYVGDTVTRTQEEFTGRFCEASIGHIVDMFGKDLMSEEYFDELIELPIETKPIPIMDRTAVNRPFLTGVTGIDMIYPIGRGQRQLILGDKKTGKTQLCLDAIVNQKEQKVVCIYVAVGKTKKEVKEIYTELLRRGAMEYTLILAAFNDECPPVLRNTPFVGMAIAEHLMLKYAIDVCVVIDDLKKHADVYREISLLTGKVPGRDAYPSDIFYIHASLLERGCQHKNGGSVTVLPIVETKSEDITEYIASNVISITDGQIVLSQKNFEKGFKPAIDYGLSVSRLGGAVQTHTMRKMGATVRRELLSYLESCEIYELANMDEMSPELRKRMENGKKLRNHLKQYKFSPLSQQEMLGLFDGLLD